jgi:hypothetical protein
MRDCQTIRSPNRNSPELFSRESADSRDVWNFVLRRIPYRGRVGHHICVPQLLSSSFWEIGIMGASMTNCLSATAWPAMLLGDDPRLMGELAARCISPAAPLALHPHHADTGIVGGLMARYLAAATSVAPILAGATQGACHHGRAGRQVDICRYVPRGHGHCREAWYDRRVDNRVSIRHHFPPQFAAASRQTVRYPPIILRTGIFTGWKRILVEIYKKFDAVPNSFRVSPWELDTSLACIDGVPKLGESCEALKMGVSKTVTRILSKSPFGVVAEVVARSHDRAFVTNSHTSWFTCRSTPNPNQVSQSILDECFLLAIR